MPTSRVFIGPGGRVGRVFRGPGVESRIIIGGAGALSGATGAPLLFADPGISTTSATSAPNTAAAGSALALVLTDGTDGTINGSQWYRWNEATKSLGTLIGSAGSIAGDTEAVTRPNFFYGNSGSTLDVNIILPQDPGGFNPQRSKGLSADGGIYLQNWNRIRVVGGEIDVRTDFVRTDGGIGLNLSGASTLTTQVDGFGFHDERMRAFRIRNYNSVHLEGIKVAGANLYEALDVSDGNSTSSVLQVQRCQFGDPTNPIHNLDSFSNFYTSNDGAVRQKWHSTFDHSGGDCLQTWTGPQGIVRVAQCEFHTNFQALFLAWDDVSSASPTASYDIRRNEIHSYRASKGPWLYYDTKSGTLAPPSGFYDANTVALHGYTATLSTLLKTGSYGGGRDFTIGSGAYAGRAATDWSTAGIPSVSAHGGSPAFIAGTPLVDLGPQGTTTQGRVGAAYNPALWGAVTAV